MIALVVTVRTSALARLWACLRTLGIMRRRRGRGATPPFSCRVSACARRGTKHNTADEQGNGVATNDDVWDGGHSGEGAGFAGSALAADYERAAVVRFARRFTRRANCLEAKLA